MTTDHSQLPNLSAVHVTGQPHVKEIPNQNSHSNSEDSPKCSKHSDTLDRPLLGDQTPNVSSSQAIGQTEDQNPPADIDLTSKRLTYAFLLLVVTCINSTFSLMAPIFPQEAERRRIQPSVTGIIFAIYSFTNFFVSPLHGFLMQRRYIRRRSMLLLGIAVSSLASLGFALSVYINVKQRVLFSAVSLILRVINGVGAAAVDTSSMAIVSEMFKDSEHFGILIGFEESCLAVGWMVGPLLGGYLAVWGGFSAPFYAAALIGLIMLPIPILMRDRQQGALTTAQQASSGTYWALLSNLEILLLMLTTVLAAAAITFNDSVLATFLQDTEGFGEGTVGVMFAVIALAYAIFTPLAGWISDKTSPTAVILTGLLVTVLPFWLLGPSPALKPLLSKLHLGGVWHIWASLGLLGVGCAMSLMPILPAMLAAAEREGLSEEGIEDLSSGLIGGAFYAGGGLGPIIGGVAMSLIGFGWASTSYGIGLLLLSTILAITLLLAKRKQRKRTEQSEPLLSDDC